MLINKLLEYYYQFYNSLLTNDKIKKSNNLIIEQWQSKVINNQEVVFEPIQQNLSLCTIPKNIIKLTSEFNNFINKGCDLNNVQIVYAYLDTFVGLEEASDLSKTYLILFKSQNKYQAIIVSGVLSLFCHVKHLVNKNLLKKLIIDTENTADINLVMQRLTNELMKICEQNTNINISWQYKMYRIINNQYFALLDLKN